MRRSIRDRLDALCAAYGARPAAALDALDAVQSREAERIERLGRQGHEPWATFLARGDASEMVAERSWLRSERTVLLGVRPAEHGPCRARLRSHEELIVRRSAGAAGSGARRRRAGHRRQVNSEGFS